MNYLGRTGDPTTEVVVTASTPAGTPSPLGIVNLRANGVVLRGFTVQGNTSGPGVFTDPAYSGYLIEGNLIRANSDGGLHLNSSGATPSSKENGVQRRGSAPGVRFSSRTCQPSCSKKSRRHEPT